MFGWLSNWWDSLGYEYQWSFFCGAVCLVTFGFLMLMIFGGDE
jgi:hypothetical protein